MGSGRPGPTEEINAMSQSAEVYEFQAEVKQLLELMVHSLYSDKDIFLRELISNASDALDKLRFEQLTRPDLNAGELGIRIDADRENRTLSIIDNGIGMTRDELVQNIGTIAKSGTSEFLNAVREAQRSEVPPELIGQFGVGFYSVFMVADKVTVVTRRAGQTSATVWESTGDGSFTIQEGERNQVGTTVMLHLKPLDLEQGLRDFTDHVVIRDIVRRYSDFVGYPIRMKVWKEKQEGGAAGAKVFEDQTLNSMKAIWDRPKTEVTEGEYRDFYRHISHDWSEPLRTLPIKLEGTFEAHALLYVPSKAPFDLYSQEMKRGVQLYVKRVFVMDECRELLPSYLRFIKGVVDAHDLSLNVSREMLQKDRQIQSIRKQLVRNVLSTLEEMKQDSVEEYARFWAEFGPVLKEGLVDFEAQEKERLLGLLMAPSTKSETDLVSLEQYVGHMKEGQEAIYYLTGPSKETLRQSPLLESFREQDIEVLLFSDPVDEFWLERSQTYKERPLRSVGRGSVKIGPEAEQKKTADALEEKQKEYSDLLTCLRVHLQDEIKEVRLSNRLRSSAACLVADEHDLSPRMQKLLEQLGQKPPKTKRILEVNPEHPLTRGLQTVFQKDRDDPRLKSFAELLLGQAHLGESGQLEDPSEFSKALADIMLRAVKD